MSSRTLQGKLGNRTRPPPPAPGPKAPEPTPIYEGAPLPHGHNMDKRPVWEPPMFNYSSFIGDEYEQQRKALLEYYEGDVAKTTKFLDLKEENSLLQKYGNRVNDGLREAIAAKDHDKKKFYRTLDLELDIDCCDVGRGFEETRDILVA